jgi:DNA-binding protein HU-alpha
MNRVELEAYVSEKTSIPKDLVSKVIGETMEAMAKSISEGDTVRLVGYFTMTAKDRPERLGKNPKTGESITIPASRRIAFKPGKKLTDAIA